MHTSVKMECKDLDIVSQTAALAASGMYSQNNFDSLPNEMQNYSFMCYFCHFQELLTFLAFVMANLELNIHKTWIFTETNSIFAKSYIKENVPSSYFYHFGETKHLMRTT